MTGTYWVPTGRETLACFRQPLCGEPLNYRHQPDRLGRIFKPWQAPAVSNARGAKLAPRTGMLKLLSLGYGGAKRNAHAWSHGRGKEDGTDVLALGTVGLGGIYCGAQGSQVLGQLL